VEICIIEHIEKIFPKYIYIYETIFIIEHNEYIRGRRM